MWKRVLLLVCLMQLVVSFSLAVGHAKSASLLGGLARRLPHTVDTLGKVIPSRPKPGIPVAPLTSQTPAYLVGENAGNSETDPIMLIKAQGVTFPKTRAVTLAPPSMFTYVGEDIPMTLPSFNEMPLDASPLQERATASRVGHIAGVKRHANSSYSSPKNKHFRSEACPGCSGKPSSTTSALHTAAPRRKIVKMGASGVSGGRGQQSQNSNSGMESEAETETETEAEAEEEEEAEEEAEDMDLLTREGLLSRSINKLSIPSPSAAKKHTSPGKVRAGTSKLVDAGTQTDPEVRRKEFMMSSSANDWTKEGFFKRLNALSNVLLKRYSEVLKMESEAEGDRALLRSVIESLAKEQKLVRIDTRLVRVDVELQMAIRGYKTIRKEKEKIEAALADVEHYRVRLQSEKTKIIDLILENPEMEEKLERPRHNLDRRAKFANSVLKQLSERYEKVTAEVKEASEAIDKLETEKAKLETTIKVLEDKK